MKPSLISLAMISLLLASTLTVPGATTPPSIRLPAEPVTMNAVYTTQSYFVITLSDVPTGYDITNGTYPGWCVQKTIHMIQHVNHTVMVYSSYDPNQPESLRFRDWDKINYILNHKHGSRDSIQTAIWYYSDNIPCETDHNATIMVNDAEQNGSGFIPSPGELLAIPIKGVSVIQLTFLELTIPLPSTLEGLVWYDTNKDSLQDQTEPGIPDIMVHLYQTDNLLIKTTTTNTQGYYTYSNITPGNYYLQFVLPSGYRFSASDIGNDDTLDSDANQSTGKTIIFTVPTNDSNTTWDTGMYKPPSKRTSPRNHPPTADATAGEPYNGFAYELLIFNGSRSYDRDSTITSWRWDYGDGTREYGQTTLHAYEHPGVYTVTLTVTDTWYAADVYTTTAHITSGNNPSSTPEVTGPTSGQVNVTYRYTVRSTDPDDDTLLYVVDWGDGSHETSPFFTSGNAITTTHRWTTYGFYKMRIYAVDHYSASSNVYEMGIAIDVHHISNQGYLIDTDSDGRYDKFHSNTTAKETAVLQQGDGYYRIDTDADKRWDIIYDPASHHQSAYQELPILDYVIFIILVISFLLILYLGRIKRRTITFSKK